MYIKYIPCRRCVGEHSCCCRLKYVQPPLVLLAKESWLKSFEKETGLHTCCRRSGLLHPFYPNICFEKEDRTSALACKEHCLNNGPLPGKSDAGNICHKDIQLTREHVLFCSKRVDIFILLASCVCLLFALISVCNFLERWMSPKCTSSENKQAPLQLIKSPASHISSLTNKAKLCHFFFLS